MRNEYTKTPRYYFWDNGIRNSIISNLNPIHIRNDSGQLWENYCISERQKFLSSNRIFINRFFWRTYTQKEIDYPEDREGILHAYEMKYSGRSAKVCGSQAIQVRVTYNRKPKYYGPGYSVLEEDFHRI